MALTLKKTFAVNEICGQWIVFGGSIYITITIFPDPTGRDVSATGQAFQVRQSVDGGDTFTTIYEESSFDGSGGRLVVFDAKLYLLDHYGANIVIRERTGGAWVLRKFQANKRISDFAVSADGGLFIVSGGAMDNQNGKLLRWSGVLADSITTISDPSEAVGGVCIDTVGHIYYVTHIISSPNRIKIWKIDKDTLVQTNIYESALSGLRQARGIRVFNGMIYYIIDQTGGTVINKYDSLAAGGTVDHAIYTLPDALPVSQSFPRYWSLFTGTDDNLYLSFLDDDMSIYIVSLSLTEVVTIEKHYASLLIDRQQVVRHAWGWLEDQAGVNLIIGANNQFFETAEVEPPPPPDPVEPGVLTIDSQPVNEYNLVSWFSGQNGPVNFTEIECENCHWDIPKGFNEGRDFQRMHAIIMARLETNAFYLNFNTPSTDPDFANFKLGLIDSAGLVKDDIGTLLKHDVTVDNYNIYCTNVVIPIDVQPAIYRMIIYDSVTEAVKWMSNAVEVMTIAQAKIESVSLAFRHSYNIYKYYYQLIDSSFLNMIRIRLYRVDENTDGTLTQYRSVSSGALRNVSFELDKFIALESYWFDDLAHRGMMVLQAHGFISINGKLYLPKALYKWEFDSTKNYTKGKIELFEQDFSTANRYKPLVGITIIGSEEPLLLGDGGGFIKL